MATSRTARKRATDQSSGDADAGAGADELPDFEASIGELDALVERLEGGELSLGEALEAYARGVRLSATCQKALDAAQRRVAILSGEASADDDAPPSGESGESGENLAPYPGQQ